MRKILLDTNAYCAFMAGDQEILQAISKADCVYMSVFVRGELYYGFRGGTKGRQNRQWLEQFTKKATVQILDATDTTAQIFGDIKYALRKAGTPIPVNDVWIAAHTKETGATLVSYDEHFKSVPTLRLWKRVR